MNTYVVIMEGKITLLIPFYVLPGAWTWRTAKGYDDFFY